MDNHLSPTVLGTSCRPGGFQKKKGSAGKDQSLSLEFQEYTEWKRNRRWATKVVTNLLPNRRKGDEALTSGPN